MPGAWVGEGGGPPPVFGVGGGDHYFLGRSSKSLGLHWCSCIMFEQEAVSIS